VTRPRYTLFAMRARPVVPGLASLGVVALAWLAWPYTVDDAFITARYARNLATGAGYAMNPGVTSDGVTGPLWLLPGVSASALGGDPVSAAKACGIACAALACWLVIARLQRRTGGALASCVAALVLVGSPSYSTWAGAGLETGAASLFFAMSALAATRRSAPSGIALGACVGALAWLRPELAVPCAVLLVHAVSRDRREGLRAVALASTSALGVLVFRFSMFGDWLPLAFRAKAGSLEHGLRYTLQSSLLATSGAGLALCWLAFRRGRSDDRVLGATGLACLGAVVLAGGDWMPGYRLLVPALPLYAWLVGVGSSRLSAHRPKLVAALVLVSLSVPALDLATRIPDLRASASVRARASELVARLRSAHDRVALVDVGFIGYASGVEVIDLAGLTDSAVARMPGGHVDKRIDPSYLRTRDPNAIVLHSAAPPRVGSGGELLALQGFPVERRLVNLAWVRERFRVERVFPCAPHYFYVLLGNIKPDRGR